MTENKNQFRILIVDDDPINLSLIKAIILSILPETFLIEAVDGRDAIEKYNTERPDMIFLDIQMPEVNGYEVAIEIRKTELENRIPIVAVTAGAMEGTKERCLASGMDDFSNKPIVRKVIDDLIQKWLLKETQK